MPPIIQPLRRVRPLLLLVALVAAACGDPDPRDADTDKPMSHPATLPVSTTQPATASPPAMATETLAATATSTVAHDAIPTAGDGPTDALFKPGLPWQGQSESGISQQEVEQFAGFPVFWLGAQVAGYNLQDILHDLPTPWVGFIYGACREYPCAPPIQIRSEPVCATRPETLLGGQFVDDLETVRGEAQMVRLSDGSVRLWTGQVGIKLSIPDPALADQLVQDMQAINRPIQTGDPLPPPDFSMCSN